MSLQDLVEKYDGGMNDFEWVKLKNDGDTVEVRSLDGKSDEFSVFEVHRIEIDGFNKPVKCLGDKCPACARGDRPQLRIWFAFINLETKGVELWERGISEIKNLMGYLEEYGDLDNRNYKIRRNGKAGSTKTTYMWIPQDKKEYEGELPEKPEIDGWVVANLSEEDMQLALEGRYTFKKDDEEDVTNVF